MSQENISLVQIVIVNDEEEYGRKAADKFNDHLMLFRHFYSADEAMDPDKDMPQEDTTLQFPIDGTRMEQDQSDIIQEELIEDPYLPRLASFALAIILKNIPIFSNGFYVKGILWAITLLITC